MEAQVSCCFAVLHDFSLSALFDYVHVFLAFFPGAIAGVCSMDGRHLAMMPHPERCTQMWQWPWAPSEWNSKVHTSPWMRMFHNAYTWCVDNA